MPKRKGKATSRAAHKISTHPKYKFVGPVTPPTVQPAPTIAQVGPRLVEGVPTPLKFADILPMAIKAPKITEPQFLYIAMVPVHLMEVEHAAQRLRTDMRRADEIAMNWDNTIYDEIKIFKISDTQYFIGDGAHRWSAAVRRGIKELSAKVYPAFTPEYRAYLFDMWNKGRKLVNKRDQFRVQHHSNKPAPIAIEATLNKHGFSAVNGKRPLTFIRTLEQLHAHDQLDSVARLVGQVWPKERVKGFMWLALGLVFESGADHDRLLDVLTRRRHTVDQWRYQLVERPAHGVKVVGHDLPRYLAAALIRDVYNKNLKGRTPRITMTKEVWQARPVD